MANIGVLGSGSWGTALAVLLARAGHSITLWARRRDLAEAMARERENRTYLPGFTLPENIDTTHRLEDLERCEPVLLVVPSHGFRQVLREFLAARSGGAPLTLISGTKGIETETLARMSQVCFEEAVKADREVRYAVLSGPAFAAELAAGKPSASVIAAEDGAVAGELQALLTTPSYRLYSSLDVVGVELGGTTKNVVAIAAGAVVGLGLGPNTLATLITRGLHEITRLGLALGGQARTFYGLAGLGDLVLTCTGDQSRNRRTGVELARGKTLEEITSGTSMVAEGIRNAVAVARVAAAKGVEMPITEQVVKVLYEDKPPAEAVGDLMSRELKAEAEL